LTLVEKYKKVKRRFDPQSRIDKKGMGLDPVIDFNMRLGEGTCAALKTLNY
jgi:NaMN:DMB phosphoribosyltransferase